MRAVIVALCMVVVGLAGCAGGSDDTLQPEEALSSGLGIIRGLLVDDRFRPIQLTEDAKTEFQAGGFIIVQETGDQLQTTENGEFESVPLEPGDYTLRFTIDDHEATPQSVRVRAGEATETTVVARRVVSSADLLVQREFSVFIPCMFAVVVTPIGICALMDLSGDTTRYVFRMNITDYQDAHFMINELVLNKDAGSLRDGTYMMQMEGPNPDGGATSYNFVTKFIEEGKYDKTIVEKGVADPEIQQDPLLTHGTWEDDMEWVGWRFWGQGLLRKDLNEAGVPVPYGVGPQVAMKAKVLTTFMFTEDRAVAEASCWLCE